MPRHRVASSRGRPGRLDQMPSALRRLQSERKTRMAEPADWQSFYVMAGGAPAALTGLIFVAVSLQRGPIMANRIHRDRAWASVALLLSQLIIALGLLAPAQSVLAIGLEIDL